MNLSIKDEMCFSLLGSLIQHECGIDIQKKHSMFNAKN
jgi:hypothetical protein